MPTTRGQWLAGVSHDGFQQLSPSQLKAQLRALDISNYLPLGSCLATTTSPLGQSTSIDQIATAELIDNPSSYLPGNLALADNLNLLLLHHWIRIVVAQRASTGKTILRIYVLPDDVAGELIVRDSAKLRSTLRSIIGSIDCSAETWSLGDHNDHLQAKSYVSTSEATDALYYLFNNVTSPQPDPEKLNRDANFYAMEDILKEPLSLGLKSFPYDYQQRSAAFMLSREAEPQLHIDPRLEQKVAPTGEMFYLDSVEGTVLRQAKMYENVRGGILAENMGSGKTFISLLLILATRGHLARIPDSYLKDSIFTQRREGLGTRKLMETAARAIRQHAVPYKDYLQDTGDVLLDYVNRTSAWYSNSAGHKIYLSSSTLVVAPPNLISHWQAEILKHVDETFLSTCTVLQDDRHLPDLQELLRHDVILISKHRFEDEFTPRQSLKRQRTDDYDDHDGLVCVCAKKRRACAKHPYRSDLANIHFLRVIVDEAMGFSETAFGNKASAALEKLIAERKWLVSGTPSKGLRGVEIDMAMRQHTEGEDLFEKQTLDQGRARPTMETEEEQVRRFGHIVTNFFRARPWARGSGGLPSDRASWSRYMIPDKYGRGKPGNLQAVVESLVVRHQIHEVSKEVPLPPLHNRVVYLDACPVDKMSLNLFTVQLIINAITSEREDQDYMFHPKQKTSLAKLFQNLRHANFFWTGLDPEDLLKAIETAERYMLKETTNMSVDDELLLKEALQIGRKTLENTQWQALSATKDMGLFVDGFPRDLRDSWGLTAYGHRSPLLMGATDIRSTQERMIPSMFASKPFYAILRSEGEEAWRKAIDTVTIGKKGKGGTVKGISQSTYDTIELTPSKLRKGKKTKQSQSTGSTLSPLKPEKLLKSALKSASSRVTTLPEKYFDISLPRLVATSSAKLSYLLDKITDLYKEEKSIIFYEDPNAGFWLAQALEIIEVPHEIYAVGIKESLRSQYLDEFQNGERIRVLLMDLRLGSHGLHLASVTRVFFVNPVWDETVEAQAIKRAHRTGQTKEVFIETLVLKGTLEDQMLKRRKTMTTQEQQQTSRGPTSDPLMHDIIKNASFLPMSDLEWSNEKLQLAPLKNPCQLYAREFIDHPEVVAAKERKLQAYLESPRSRRSSKSSSRHSSTSSSRNSSPAVKFVSPTRTPSSSGSNRPRSRLQSPVEDFETLDSTPSKVTRFKRLQQVEKIGAPTMISSQTLADTMPSLGSATGSTAHISTAQVPTMKVAPAMSLMQISQPQKPVEESQPFVENVFQLMNRLTWVPVEFTPTTPWRKEQYEHSGSRDGAEPVRKKRKGVSFLN